jgi:hypothetical protein
MSEVRTGGCHCSAVRFEARGKPKFIANCHCESCRRATGAAFSTWVGYDSGQVDWSGDRAIHASSPGVKRGFCAKCGTPLSYSGKKWPKETHLLAGVFDDASDLSPTGDAFAGEKLPWAPLIAARQPQ